MRRLICFVLAAAFILVACSGENLPQLPETYLNGSEDAAYLPEPEMPPALPPEPDFYDEIWDRGARIVASFDFDEFSIWFAITPEHSFWQMADGDIYVWDFANGANRGIPLTVAVVRNSEGRYMLVEEVPANLDLRLYDWWFEEMPDRLPWMQNHHLRIQDGYMFTNFIGTGVFRGDDWLRRQALMVHTGQTMSLLYQTPMDDLGAAGETFGGMLFGMSADNNILRHLILGKEGLISDSSIVTRANYTNAFYTLGDFGFAPETNTITLGRITASAHGITEVPYEIEFEVLADGEISRTDNLLGLSAVTLTDFPMDASVSTSVQYPVIGGRIYRFPFIIPSHMEVGSQLRYSSFDLQTHTHLSDQLLHDFTPETVISHSYSDMGLWVNTDVAAYFFDDDFEIIRRIEWPRYTSGGVFDETFNFLAFRGEVDGVDGVFLYNFATGQPPVLLHESIPHDWDAEHPIESAEFLFPLLLLDGERLFAAGSYWTGFQFFRIIDSSGNVLEEFPFGATGAYGGGHATANRDIAIFFPQQREIGPHYFDFESGVLSPADWWERDELQQWGNFAAHPSNPRVWYASSIHFDGPDFPRQEETTILRLDFESKTVETLVRVPGARAELLSVGGNGEVVFAFANHMDNGFAIFHP